MAAEPMDTERDIPARFSFVTEVIYWRGPSPFFYAPAPPQHAEELRRITRAVTYGWGMTPVEAKVGDVVFTTSLFPKDGTYLLPLKADVRRRAGVTAGDVIKVEFTIQPRGRPGGRWSPV
jgi:hypothetical protein